MNITPLESLLLGVPLGVVVSILAWWIIVWSLRPRFRLSPMISARRSEDSVFYRVKVHNPSSRRTVVDLNYAMIAEFRGLSKAFPDNWESIRIPLSIYDEPFPVLRPFRGRVLRLRLDQVDPETEMRTYLSDELWADMMSNSPGVLESLLQISADSRIVFAFTGARDNSGIRRTKTAYYAENSISYHMFKKHSEQVVMPQGGR